MTATKESQTRQILRLFKAQKRVTNRELNQICFRYGARLHEMRRDGYIIATNRVKDGLFEFIYKGHVDETKVYS